MNRLKNNGIKTVLVLVMGLLVLVPGALHARLDCYAPEVPEAPCVDTTMGDDEAVDAEASDVIEEEDLGPVYCNKDLYDAVRACNLAAVQEVLARHDTPEDFDLVIFPDIDPDDALTTPLHWLITDKINGDACAIAELLIARKVGTDMTDKDHQCAYQVLLRHIDAITDWFNAPDTTEGTRARLNEQREWGYDLCEVICPDNWTDENAADFRATLDAEREMRQQQMYSGSAALAAAARAVRGYACFDDMSDTSDPYDSDSDDMDCG